MDHQTSGAFGFPSSLRYVFAQLVENVSNTGRGKKQLLGLAIDAGLVIFSLWAAYAIRLSVWIIDFKSTWYLFATLPLATALIFTTLGIYRWVVRSSTARLTAQIIKGTATSTAVLVSILFLFPPTYAGTPRSIFIIYGLVLIATTLGSRYFWRVLVNSSGNLKKGEPVALYGAGYAGRQLLSVLRNSKEYRPVLFLDDDPTYRGSTVSGLQVHNFDAAGINELLKRFEVSSVILSMPSIDGQTYNEIVKSLSNSKISIKTIPAISELLLGQAAIDEVRELKIEDLLGRAPVKPDLEYAGTYVRGKSIMVTGGGGSIGSEISRQVLLMNAAKLIVVEQSEENLYKLIEEVSTLHDAVENGELQPEFVPVLGSVNDRKLIGRLLEAHEIEIVYHAAACKHVPIVEDNPGVGVRTNVFGTLTVLEEATRLGINSFVLISTDKAVRPENVMGASKRLAEMILQAKARQSIDTRICMVRFGNVLGSSGSVVPKFLQQIESGGPITVTHPKMTRYFMTIPEASQLVIQASTLAGNGEVFVLDMGEPVRIVDLASSMIRIQGKKFATEDPVDGIDIVFEGIRPGEKIAEELFISSSVSSTPYEKIFQERVDALEWGDIEEIIGIIEKYIDNGEPEKLQTFLMKITRLDSNNIEKWRSRNIDGFNEEKELASDRLT